jgi:hypothetical protein
MQYSRKGFWLSQAAAAGLVALLVAYSFWKGTGGLLPYFSAVVMVLCGALSFRALFHLDEIQQAEYTHIYAHGALIGVFATGVLIPFLQTQPALLQTLMDIQFRHSTTRPVDYFIAGFTLLLVTQIIGSMLVQLAMRLKSRA